MTDPHTPTTEEVRLNFLDSWDYYNDEPYGDARDRERAEQFDRWLAAHDATVRAEGAAEMRERAAVVAEDGGIHHGELSTEDDIAKRIRALSPLGSDSGCGCINNPNDYHGGIDRDCPIHGVRALPPLSPQRTPIDARWAVRMDENDDFVLSDGSVMDRKAFYPYSDIPRPPLSPQPDTTFMHIADASGKRHSSNPTVEDVERVQEAIRRSWYPGEMRVGDGAVPEPTGDER